MFTVGEAQLKHSDDSLLDIRCERRIVVRQKYSNDATVFPVKIGRMLTQWPKFTLFTRPSYTRQFSVWNLHTELQKQDQRFVI